MAEQNKKGEHSQRKFNKFNRVASSEHSIKKRPPQKHQVDKSTIYVSTKSNTKYLLNKCSKLILDENVNELTVFCLGAAIQRGIILALEICEQHPTFQNHVNTITTEIIDDLEPATDAVDYEIQKRNNSALRIRVFRTDPLSKSQDIKQEPTSSG